MDGEIMLFEINNNFKYFNDLNCEIISILGLVSYMRLANA